MSELVIYSKRNISIVVLAVFFVAAFFYFSSNQQVFERFGNVSFEAILFLTTFRILFLVTNGLFLRELALKFGLKLTPKEWFGLSAVTSMGNYLSPLSGGTIVRASYLRYRHAFPFSQFAAILASNYLLCFLIIGSVGLPISMRFWWMGKCSVALSFGFLLMAVVLVILMLIPLKSVTNTNRFAEFINRSMEGWRLIKNDGRLLYRLSVLALVNIMLNGLTFWIAYQSMGFFVSIDAAILISLIAVFSMFASITPGNLGLQEATVSLTSGLVGVGMTSGLMAALLIRAVTIVVVFTFGSVFSLLLAQEMRR